MSTNMHPARPASEEPDGAARTTWSRWRTGAWSVAGLLLLLPLVAMQFTDEVNWSAMDFVVMACVMLAVGIPFELAVRKRTAATYRIAAGVALAAAFLLVWVNLAVGIIGDEGNPANLMYAGVLAVGVIGAAIARFRPQGMARALAAAAFAQVLVAAITLITRLGLPASGPGEVIGVNGIFVALFAASAWLFHRAARQVREPVTR